MWDEVGDRQLFGPNVIKESEENVKLIRDRLKVAWSRQKSYVDSKLEMEHVFVCSLCEELNYWS